MSTEYNLNDAGDVTLVVEEKDGQALVTVRNKFHFTKKMQFPPKRWVLFHGYFITYMKCLMRSKYKPFQFVVLC